MLHPESTAAADVEPCSGCTKLSHMYPARNPTIRDYGFEVACTSDVKESLDVAWCQEQTHKSWNSDFEAGAINYMYMYRVSSTELEEDAQERSTGIPKAEAVAPSHLAQAWEQKM